MDSLNDISHDRKYPVLLKTNSGLEIEANLVYICVGTQPCSDFLSNHEICLNDKGLIKVNENLQVSCLSNDIFACGDITDIVEEKLAQTSAIAARIVASNIVKLANNSSKSLSVYKAGVVPVVISLGKYDAIFTYGNFSFSGFVPALVKELVEWKVLVAVPKRFCSKL